jgi:hypothetical protein
MYQVPIEMKNAQPSTDTIAEANSTLLNLSTFRPNNNRRLEPELSSKRLQEAIIWSEILGNPVSKRRKRRYHGY